MHHKRPLHVELAQRERDFLDHAVGKNPRDLRTCAGRIGQWSEQVERGTSQAPPRGHGVTHRGVQGRSKEKADSNLVNGNADALR